MRALVRPVVVSLVAALAVPAAALAGVRTEERTQVQFSGLLGGLMTHFGGKSAKEGLVNTVAVVGDRRLTLNEETGEIVDLAEGKVYELNVKDRTYEVATFEEIGKRFEEQREKAQKEAEKARKEQAKQTKQEPRRRARRRSSRWTSGSAAPGRSERSRATRRRRPSRGSRSTRRAPAMMQSGGMAIVNEQWLAPDVPELGEIAEFNLRYAQKMADVFGFDAARMKASAEQMAALLAAHPGLVQALEKMKTEGREARGHAADDRSSAPT